MDTGIIARPGESIKANGARPCGCEGKVIGIRRCDEAARLWDKLIEVRDALRAAGHRPPKPTIDAFAAARNEYHLHIRGEVA